MKVERKEEEETKESGSLEPREKKRSSSLVVEVVDVLHVAEDDVLLAGDACRNLLHAVGHLPQVRLGNNHSD